ncbi:hypothetical protein ACS3UN_01735 [Oscillospiraceae bacterium LTW-04]|nr:hypothetical protein RBH76_08725 [Oscillospiraceae bacterium MB24-C1]
MIKTHLTRFYLSANTPLGFVSRLNMLCDADRFSRILLLKGGTRKRRAELISFAAKAADAAGHCVHLVASVDSASAPEAAYWGDTALIDSAHPHVIEPRYPGVVEEILWLGDCFDTEKLRQNKPTIIALTDKEERLREQSRRYLCAADALCNDNYRIALEATNLEKIERQADRIADKAFKGQKSVEEVRIYSDGYQLLPELSSMDNIKNVVLLEDEYGPSSGLLLKALHKRALNCNCHVICGYSPLAPFERLEQLIFPELSLAFLTANERLMVTCEPQRIINARRFTNKEILATHKNRIAFNRKAARQMFQQSHSLLKSAQKVHAQLELFYDGALDQARFNQLCERATAVV